MGGRVTAALVLLCLIFRADAEGPVPPLCWWSPAVACETRAEAWSLQPAFGVTVTCAGVQPDAAAALGGWRG